MPPTTGMRTAVLLLALAVLGCSSIGGARSIDRTGFDLAACDDGSLLDAVTAGVPVDYLEWRSSSGGLAATGLRCEGASDRPACEMALANLAEPSDAWPATTPGGIPAPPTHLVYTRGDEVGAVGRGGLPALFAPLGAADAAFIAQAATTAGVPCGEPRVREVPGGHEVILTRNYTCGGGEDEVLAMVGEDGAVEVLETVAVSEGEDIVCP